MHLRNLYLEKPQLMLFVGGLLYYLTFFNYGIVLDDEGFFLMGASSITEGSWPIADFFSYPPLSYFLLAGFNQLFGEGVLTERILLVSILLLNAQLLLYISRSALPALWAPLPVILYTLAPGPWYKVIFIASIIWVLAGLLYYLKRPNSKRAALIGFLIGAAFISRHQAGIITLILGFGTLLSQAIGNELDRSTRNRREIWITFGKQLFSMLSLLIIILSLMALAYVIAGKWDALISNINLYYWQNHGREVMGKQGIISRFNPFSLFTRPQAEQWFYALGVAGAFTLFLTHLHKFFLSNTNRAKNQLRLVIAVTAIGTLAYTYLFVWNSRMLSSFAVIYIVWSIILSDIHLKYIHSGNIRLSRWVPIAGIFTVSLFAIWFCRVHIYSGSLTVRFFPTTELDHPLMKGMHIYSRQQADITRMMELTAENKAATLIPMSEATTMSYLSGLNNPTFYRLFTTEFGAPGEPQTVLQEIENNCIDYFVARRKQFMAGGETGSNLRVYAPEIRTHLIKSYSVTPLGERFVLLSRTAECSDSMQ
ncbi:MAG: hypothetical protein DIZ78_15340 [endosymbiont of Escarpia spicata]|uniref:Glycosyltransferase RgtA/B/C/D-like domain-containing protein n=1 Tax=endosymbiont of Escarpia spicata TaxID=2200908 RepID=A0A370DEM0_9GAMM|nr:MAG: hypothetical protein DIZ78_15340 [endosymbiont of Escarpia spicata]